MSLLLYSITIAVLQIIYRRIKALLELLFHANPGEERSDHEFSLRAMQSGSEEKERLLQQQLADEHGRRQAAVHELDKMRLDLMERDTQLAQRDRKGK